MGPGPIPTVRPSAVRPTVRRPTDRPPSARALGPWALGPSLNYLMNLFLKELFPISFAKLLNELYIILYVIDMLK